jgi:hypothetical protein
VATVLDTSLLAARRVSQTEVLMNRLIGTTLVALMIPTVALGDDWKGGGKGWKDKDWKGPKEGGWKAKDWKDGDGDWDDDDGPPGWSRGRGSWDGQWSPSAPYGQVPFSGQRIDIGGASLWIESNRSSLIPWSTEAPQEVQPARGLSPEQELAEADDGALRRVGYESLVAFDGWLAQIPAGEMWRRHFGTRAGLELLSPNRDAARFPEDQATFAGMLATFDEAVENADLAAITQTDEFRRSRAALRELAAPSDERLVRQLSFRARNLNRSLARLNTGPKWQRYLALPDDIVAAADRPSDITRPTRGVDRAALVPVLERFEVVSRNPEFRSVAALPAFAATHEKLTALLRPQPAAQLAPQPEPQPAPQLALEPAPRPARKAAPQPALQAAPQPTLEAAGPPLLPAAPQPR